MALFKERRVKFLALAVLISVMIVWKPWAGLNPQARGLNFAVDTAGGSRAVLWLEVSHITIETSEENLDSAWNSIGSGLMDNLNTTVNLVAQYPAEQRIVVEIGMSVSSAFIQEIIGELGTVVDAQNYATSTTQDNVISMLQARVDPYGMLGMRLRSLGDNRVLFETTQLDDSMKKLIIKQGRLEFFIENVLVLTDEDIEIFGNPTIAGTGYSSIPVEYTYEGEETLKVAVEGKLGRPGVVYLDRPSDAILIVNQTTLNELSKITYDNSARAFVYTTEDYYTGDEVHYTLLVPSIVTPTDNLSEETHELLENNVGTKLRVLLLGNLEDFADMIENIPENYRIENISQLSGESEDKWIKRACGIISDFPVALGTWVNRILIEANLQEAKNFRAILSNKSPVELALVSEAEIEAHLGGGFGAEVLIAGAVAVGGMFLLIYYRYKHWKICLAFIVFTLCELSLTLGGASVLGLTIGLPELAGLLIVIGTGIDHQLITTDAMLRGGHPEKAGASWRASRMLPLIYASIFMTLAVMVPIAALGFGTLRGFAIITITGIILALLFTRPTYSKVIDGILISGRASAT